MCSNLVILAVFIFTLIISQTTANPLWGCTPCTSLEECDSPPKKPCPWGETRNSCGRRTCMKGPGGRCGGPHKIHGDCGEGLMCKKDELCHGCHMDSMTCFE